ncbi:MAG: hypothetical protein A3I77_04295 [Gammaproteobacteria bacterium RIFCSPLOWO2_02_FULL_42_14]|nr:MAG: hypothetical protein A3B71_05595 [Gammaproteobacteria bacterium RIFCSPHIGHO2_02_FULL_42_43]OGT51466.1 MAG: hypothetical protein A3E54_05360 [Gammaproteobacteria bacterium RIFCSPHIGHO2_12_FULL_41_25]OGT62167.1 MAG: hypothetical protein A3I77_04295 [Gammaproteobacteria bacterium RIFCSPLOWO2_02_FULL_42_14]OGT85840.1 MAG: hypothetical protein A3G86_03985 [Gammaproteobacteria bacterium RIFCSPLOWO2_12_FULL_42_18]
MKFSIIVPTYNEKKDITPTLEALAALDYSNYEVFMVDDSTDSTPDIIKQYADKNIQLIKPGGGGRCEARNLGIQRATGDVVVILNADVQLPKDFLNQIKKHYDAGADLVSVSSKAINDDRLFARYIDCAGLYLESDFHGNEILWTEGFSCRRELALKAGLFPAGFPVAMFAGEDGYFAENLVKAGGTTHVDLNIVVHHIAPADFKEYWYIRTTRGRATSQYRRYINRWSFKKIAFWNFLKTGFNVLKCATLFYPIIYCWKLTSFSKYGKKDWIKLLYAHVLEMIAMTYGLWKELYIIYKKEKMA